MNGLRNTKRRRESEKPYYHADSRVDTAFCYWVESRFRCFYRAHPKVLLKGGIEVWK